jgi:hypothetical protein
MAALTVTLSSAGVSPSVIILNPVLKATSVQLSVTAGSIGTNFIQYTLDDPTQQQTLGVFTTPVWANLSSAVTSAGIDPATGQGGIMYSVLTPIGGLRISSSTYTGGTVTLKALQAITG